MLRDRTCGHCTELNLANHARFSESFRDKKTDSEETNLEKSRYGLKILSQFLIRIIDHF